MTTSMARSINNSSRATQSPEIGMMTIRMDTYRQKPSPRARAREKKEAPMSIRGFFIVSRSACSAFER